MVHTTKEACQDTFTTAQVYTLSSGAKGLTLADMEAIFGRLARCDSITGGERNAFILESEDQERTRIFNFTEIPLTKVGQDGIRTVIIPRDPTLFTPFILPTWSSSTNVNTEAWWTALAKTQTNPHDLLNKIVILRSRFFTGANVHEIQQQLKHSRLAGAERQTLLSSLPFSAYYCGKRIVAVYAMFMYVLDISDFCGYAHLHERNSGTFLTMNQPFNAPAHPHDVNNTIIDCRPADQAGEEHPPVWLTHRIVFHTQAPRARYLNDHGTILEINPVRDTSTQEGYYKTVVHAAKSSGIPGKVERAFLEMAKLTEETGFYFSAEAAKENLSRQASEKIALANQQSQETLYKGWLTQAQADAKQFTQLTKETTSVANDKLRDLLVKNTDAYKTNTDATIKENKQLHEKLKNMGEELNDAKRTHDKDMAIRKEQLELLKLVPALIAIVTAIIALSKGAPKKK